MAVIKKEQITRAIQLDFHTSPGIENFLKDFKADEFAERLKKSHVTYLTAFAQCNAGNAYYATKLGTPYPGERAEQLFPSIVSECHKRGIKVSAYLNIGINQRLAKQHADWLRVSKDGKIMESGADTDVGFTSLCYNSPYRQYLLALISEIAALGADGIFCDCIFNKPCYCSYCKEKMKQRGLDYKNEEDVRRFSYDTLLEISKEIRSRVPKEQYFILNGMPYDAVQDIASHIEVECLPSGLGGWGEDYFPAQAAVARKISDNVVYMSGRFHASWGDFGGIKSRASLENDMYDALMNGTGFSVGDHMHPHGRLNDELYDRIGEMYAELAVYEKWTESTEYLAQVGVLRNRSDYRSEWLSEYHKGVARMLSELKYGFDIIDETMDFSTYEVLILPDAIEVTKNMAEKISVFIKNGGRVLSSGKSGLSSDGKSFSMLEWDFISVRGQTDSRACYYRTAEPVCKEINTAWATYAPGILMDVKKSGTALAHLSENYFSDVWDKHYFDVTWGGTSDLYSSHLYYYIPPKEEVCGSAAAFDGRVCHISFEIFCAYYNYAAVFHKELVSYILKQMLKEPLIKAEALPSTSRASLCRGEKYDLLHVKATYPQSRGPYFHIIEEHNTLPAGTEISVKGKYKSVRLLPEEKEIGGIYQDGYTTISLPEIRGYAMFQLIKG